MRQVPLQGQRPRPAEVARPTLGVSPGSWAEASKRVMEIGPSQAVYAAPRHPYTRALLATAPIPDPTARRERVILQGDIPSPLDPPSGCVFRTRCPYAMEGCAKIVPPAEVIGPGHSVACILHAVLAS